MLMNRNKKQIQLMNECIDWFDHRYPALAGLLKPMPIGKTKIKRPFWFIGQKFRIKSTQIRLVFMFRSNVWIFEPYLAHDMVIDDINEDVRGERMLVMVQMRHTVGYDSLDMLSRKIISVLAEYQYDPHN